MTQLQVIGPVTPMSVDPRSRLSGFVHIQFTSRLLQRAVPKFFFLVYRPSPLHSSLTLSSHILHSLGRSHFFACHMLSSHILRSLVSAASRKFPSHPHSISQSHVYSL